MSTRLLVWRLGVGVLALMFVLASPRSAKASDILKIGFDLFDPLVGTQVNIGGVVYPFVGVPFGTFDFGPGFGVHDTANTDTVIKRTSEATGPGVGIPVSVELVAMQMVSTVMIDPGPGLDFYYLTVAAGSTGTMIWNDPCCFHGTPHGTAYYDPLTWNFEVRKGSLVAPVDGGLSGTKTLSSLATPAPWSHTPPPGALVIPGVNDFGFFMYGTFNLTNADGTSIIMRTALPEPATVVLLLFGVGTIALRLRRRPVR